MNIKQARSKNVVNQLTKLYNKPGASKAQQYARSTLSARVGGQHAATQAAGSRARQIAPLKGAYDKGVAKDVLKGIGKTAMDTQLATAVFDRWNQGLPVAETTLYKAASALGVNADDALLEARFYTMLDHDLAKLASGYPLSPAEIRFYSAAAGQNPDGLAKTASAYHIDPQELVLEKLASQGWVPNLAGIKLAMMGAPAEDPSQAGGQGMMPPGAEGGDAAMPGPMADQAVQQAPQQRFKPSPMAPAQVPPSPEGNLQELARQAMSPSPPSQDMQAGMGIGGGPGTDMAPSTPAPPPPSPEEKLQQVVPDLPPETMARYSEKMQEVEQQAGMPIEDPNQIQKFVAEMKKQDAKAIDEAIKTMGEAQPIRTASPAGQQPAPAAQPAPAPATAGAEKVASVARVLARMGI